MAVRRPERAFADRQRRAALPRGVWVFSPLALLIVSTITFSQPKPPNSTPPTVNDARQETDRLGVDDHRVLEHLLQDLHDPNLDMTRRQTAAAILLKKGWPEAVRALSEDLSGPDRPGTQRAIALAAAAHDDPPRQLLEPLLNRVGTPDAALRRAVAAALARYEDETVVDQLIARAEDEDMVEPARCGAVEMLAEHRQQRVAHTLVQLIGPPHSQPVRRAALEALGVLTGIDDFAGDVRAWQQWWQQHKDLTQEQWLHHLVRNLSARNRRASAQISTLADRLTDGLSRLYFASEPAERSAMLEQMLDDQLDVVRLLALKLIKRLQVSAQPVDDRVREAMRRHLTDRNAQVRASVAMLLGELADPEAPALVVGLLGDETNVPVLRAYLSLLAAATQHLEPTDEHGPIRQAAEPAVTLLLHSELQADAATFLLNAHEMGKLDSDQIQRTLDAARKNVTEQPSPEPLMIRLLGRLGEDDDRLLIVAQLDHEEAAVRRAAAQTFVSNDAALDPLLDRMSDPAIFPVAVDAVHKRGDQLDQALRLLEVAPDDANLQGRRQDALASVAGRLNADDQIELDNILSQRTNGQVLREHVLTDLTNNAGAPEANAGASPARVALMFRLARLYLDTARPALAETVYGRIEARNDLEAADAQRLQLGRLEVAAASGQTEKADQIAQSILTDQPDHAPAVIAVLLDVAEAQLASGQSTKVTPLLELAIPLVDPEKHPDDHARLVQLLATIHAPPPTPNTAPEDS